MKCTRNGDSENWWCTPKPARLDPCSNPICPKITTVRNWCTATSPEPTESNWFLFVCLFVCLFVFVVFVTTASNPSESSYACYYDSKRRTYLGDLYSVQWMLDSETEDLSKETLAEQYEAVKEATSQSHVMEYGDLQISQMKVSDFQGHGGKTEKRVSTRVPAELDAVPSWDVPLEILKHILSEAATVTEQRDIMQQIHLLENKRQMLVRTLEQIVVKATGDSAKTQSIMTDKMNLSEFGCYRELVNTFSQRCFNLSEVTDRRQRIHDWLSLTSFFFIFLNPIRTNMHSVSCTSWSIFANCPFPKKMSFEPWNQNAPPIAISLVSFNRWNLTRLPPRKWIQMRKFLKNIRIEMKWLLRHRQAIIDIRFRPWILQSMLNGTRKHSVLYHFESNLTIYLCIFES